MSVPEHVWYAAYGSNMSAQRFGHYLVGGQPTGAERVYPGCRDHDDLTGDRPAVLPYRLTFAGMSTNWHGGVAFVDPDHDAEERTFARLYRLRWSQLEDVMAQENRIDPGQVRLSDQVLVQGRGDIGVGWYCLAVLVTHEWGEPMLIEGEHVVTVTGPAGQHEPNAPTFAYLRYIVEGLRASHGLSDERILDYLAYRPGIKGRFSHDQLRATL